MVGTVKVVKRLSGSIGSEEICNESSQEKSPSCLKRCRFLVRVPNGKLVTLKQNSDAPQVFMSVPSSQGKGIASQTQEESTRERFGGNVSQMSFVNPRLITKPVLSPPKRPEIIVNLPNGEKGVLISKSKPCIQTPIFLPNMKDNVGHAKDAQTVNNASNLSNRFCYPPNEHTVHLLKLLTAGEILSHGELNDIVAYVNYLKSRNLVTEHLLKKKIISLMSDSSEPEALDDEPPIIPSMVRFPSRLQREQTASSEPSVPSRMPRLLEVLKSNDMPFRAARKRLADHMGCNGSRPKVATVACEMCGNRIHSTHLRMHNKICKGVLIRRRHRGTTDEGTAPPEEKRERACPKCDKVLSCDKDFEMHMAVAHKFYWRLEFDKEEEFKSWFREEGLDETMYVATCQTSPEFYTKVYYCAINRNRNPPKGAGVKCPCRLVVKQSQSGIVVRYFVLHNHPERFVRRVMSLECRDLIISLLKDGLNNYEILKKIKESYPKTSMNHYVSRDSITRLRYRYHRKESSKIPKKSLVRTRKRRSKKSESDDRRQSFSSSEDTKQQDLWPLELQRAPQLAPGTAYSNVEHVDSCSVIDVSENF